MNSLSIQHKKLVREQQRKPQRRNCTYKRNYLNRKKKAGFLEKTNKLGKLLARLIKLKDVNT